MDSRKFADKMMPFLEKYNNYTDKEKIVAHYGLETLYILVTKMFLITIISLFFGITKEIYIFTFFYAFLRTYTGGMHLQTNFGCSLMTCTIIFFSTFLAIFLDINFLIQILVFTIGLYNFYKYSPADTNKKPIINKEKRKKRKINSIILTILYLIACLLINNNFIKNCIIISVFLNVLLIHPIIYRIFKQTYNNYIIYEKMNRRNV